MGVISQSELLRLTRAELLALLRKIVCELPYLPEDPLNCATRTRTCSISAGLWCGPTSGPADGHPAGGRNSPPESAFVPRTIGNGSAGSCVMTNKSATRPQGGSEANPKIDPAPNSNTEKEPDDWVSGDDPMTGAQASYLKTLSEECGDPDSFQPDLTKAEASKRIDALKSKRRPVQHR